MLLFNLSDYILILFIMGFLYFYLNPMPEHLLLLLVAIDVGNNHSL